jgi:DNA-binding protein HU-beta
MNKDAVIDVVASQTGQPKKVVADVVESVLDVITKELQKGGKVSFSGFGAFQVTTRKGRVGINPRTKEKIDIGPTKVPRFKAGKTLKEAVR